MNNIKPGEYKLIRQKVKMSDICFKEADFMRYKDNPNMLYFSENEDILENENIKYQYNSLNNSYVVVE